MCPEREEDRLGKQPGVREKLTRKLRVTLSGAGKRVGRALERAVVPMTRRLPVGYSY
jgi:hypothetical protein